MENRVKVGDIIATPKGNGTVCMVAGGNYAVQLDNGEWYAHIEETISSLNKESKDQQFHVGDKVRTLVTIENGIPKGTIGIVEKIYETGSVCLLVALENGISNTYYSPSELELVQTRDQMEADAKDTAEHCDNPNLTETELEVLKKDALDKMIHPERQFTYEPAMDWVKYEAQLAHDITVKIVGNDIRCPKDIGNYAVSIALAVVDGLKKK